MKQIFFSTLLLVFSFYSFGQQDNTKEINEQVWLPFIKAFNNENEELFRSVHSKSIVRVVQDQNEIMNYEKYFKKVPDSVKAKWAIWKKEIELRFIQRISTNDRAFEVGYYKTTSVNTETGEKRKGIGKFHVLLGKENGKWKILMDADTSENITEDDFNKGEAIKN